MARDKYGVNRREPISFRKTIPAGTFTVIKERIKDAGTIESLRVRFYRGQQLSLRVRPYVQHKGEKNEDLITYAEGTANWLQGDDDYFVYYPVCSVENDDFIHIWVENTDLENDYTLSVDVEIDYFGGKARVIGGLME